MYNHTIHTYQLKCEKKEEKKTICNLNSKAFSWQKHTQNTDRKYLNKLTNNGTKHDFRLTH